MTALVRVDVNIESKHEIFRIQAALPSLRFLEECGARVVLLSHRGRPTRPSSKDSLRRILPLLRTYVKRPISFLPHTALERAPELIRRAKPQALFLFENLRFFKEEQNADYSFARKLAAMGDCYINDAFSVCHRAHASVVVLPKLLPAYAGIRLEQEMQSLSRVSSHARQPLVVILGGAKAADKIAVIGHFLTRAAHILVGGATANTFLKAQGLAIGRSSYNRALLPEARRLSASPRIVLPMDFIAEQGTFLDVGPLTVERFTQIISRARTVVWNGPLGFIESPKFRAGSEAIARAIVKHKPFSVAGGGETTEFIFSLGLGKRFTFLSTGGGAMIAFLAGKKLPGIEALNTHP